LATYRGILVDRHRVRLPALVQRPESSVDVDARDHDQPDTRGQSGERDLSVGAGQGAAVERRLRSKSAELTGMVAQVRAGGVEVLDRGHVVRFEGAAVHDQDLVAGGDQLFDRGPTDEPGPAEND